MNPRKKIKSRKRRVQQIMGGTEAAPAAEPLQRTLSASNREFIQTWSQYWGQEIAKTETGVDDEYSIPESQEENNMIPFVRNDSGCCTFTLEERLIRVNQQISQIHVQYSELIQKLADDTYKLYGDSGMMEHPNKEDYDKWEQKSKELLFGYQRLSVNDLKYALFALLPQFELDGGKYNFSEGSTTMIALIKNYAYKMITSLFTTANITYAVMTYAMPGEELPKDTYSYLRNLLSLMKCGSTLINTKLKNHWFNYFRYTYDPQVTYHHSGGNMIVMIAGMLCYLHDKHVKKVEDYGIDILENIRKMFHDVLGGYKDIFYDWLNTNMTNGDFKSNLYNCTENLSDMDFILFAPKHFVSDIDNRELATLSNLSGEIIRDIINDSCNYEAAVETVAGGHAGEFIHHYYARALLPFHKSFKEVPIQWPAFKYSNLTQSGMRDLVTVRECDNRGYRQTANKIEQVPMYLNRLKQGYFPFVNLTSQIPPELHKMYASKYGECIDLSIGTLQSEFYNHKHHNWECNNYYTIETLLWELKKILSNPPDDKTPKRIIRMNFLELINIQMVNVLFKVIAYHIQEYNYSEEEKIVKLAELMVKLQNEMDIAGPSSVNAAINAVNSAEASKAVADAEAAAITAAAAAKVDDTAAAVRRAVSAKADAVAAEGQNSLAQVAAENVLRNAITEQISVIAFAINAEAGQHTIEQFYARAASTAAARDAVAKKVAVAASANAANAISAVATATSAHSNFQIKTYKDYLTKIG
jgi:hypothetical protein